MAATPEETLADEARRRTKAGATAIAAGLLTLIGSILLLRASSDFRRAPLLDALSEQFDAAPPPPGQGLLARKVVYYDDHLLQLVTAQLVPAIATALAAGALLFLYLSTKARNPQLSKAPLIAAVAGAVLVIVPTLVGTVSLALDVGAFTDAANQSEQAARDVLDSTVVAAAYSLAQIGAWSVGLAFVLTALNAMRVGLLTRFMGVLGIIAGALFLLPLDGQLPFVKIFWLLALGALFLGRWQGGMPPAWVTGEAHPWPTQQELREQRSALQAERAGAAPEDAPRRPRRGRAEPPETPAPEPPRAKVHSSSKKKKRKRR